MESLKLGPCIRSKSVPTISSSINHEIKVRSERSLTFSSKSKKYRPCFFGRITASFILVGQPDTFDDLCDNYNHCDKIGLENDHPYQIRGLNLNLIKEFPNAKEHVLLSKFITKDMEEKARIESANYKFGHDFVFEHCIKNKILDKNCDKLEFLCELVIPKRQYSKYKNIDVTTVTEKTTYLDENIIDTGIRGVREELGIDLCCEYGKKIMNPIYQNEFRKQYSPHLPYNWKIGSRGRSTECFIVGVEKEDIMECQMLTQEDFSNVQYRRLEKLTLNACDI